MTRNNLYSLTAVNLSLLLIGTIIPVTALIGSPLLTVDTNKTNYEAGEAVLVSGKVSHEIMKNGEPLTIQIFNPNGQTYRLNSVNVTWDGLLSDGLYTYQFNFEGELALK